jgi:hypothetical protein
VNELVDRLDMEWAQDTGFLGKLRTGVLDREAYERFINLMQSIELEGDTIDRRLVKVLWFIPLYMEWQTERLERTSGISSIEYSRYQTAVWDILYRLLGLP